MLPRLALLGLALALTLAGPPHATADHTCDDGPPNACIGGNYHETGEGTCPGDTSESRLVLGYEGAATGSYVLAGVGWTCAGDETRQGAFVRGTPVEAFAGNYENDAHCGIKAGAFLFVDYEQDQRDDAITCMLM